ncbi:MAG: hypothetical protein JWN26_190 [Candidatus Saccharibacteria bacterium]|nr:hypothetical protein [Candidatus Saccharibacteria bacterium]
MASQRKKSLRKQIKKPLTRLERVVQHLHSFKSPYVIFSSIVLLLTSAWWSILGATLQSKNADQIINSYLFQDPHIFQAAAFPSAHSFLLKWPLFIIERLIGHSDIGLIIITVLVSLATVTGLAYILYRIDRRPQVFGTVLLALAGVLLFIPSEPYAGALLPVNFAMLTTRNIEYLVYILSLVLIIRTQKFRSWRFVASVLLMALLVSSDKLFVWLSLGGALIMAALYLITHRGPLVRLAVRWFVVTVLAAVLMTILLWAINTTGITHIVGDQTPYGLVSNLKDFGLGCIFAVMGLLTNAGANPVFDIGIAKDLPAIFVKRLASPIVIPFIINISLFIGSIVATSQLLRSSLHTIVQPKRRKRVPEFSIAGALSITLITSSVAAIGFFIFTNHYYPVDSRYLTISLFALSVTIVTYRRTRPIPAPVIHRRVTGLLLLGIVIGSIWSFSTFLQQTATSSAIDARNTKIVDAMQGHKTQTLLGDYWRVVPIGQMNKQSVEHVVPMADCTTVRTGLTSAAWSQDFEHKSFTYLLTLEKGSTGYPACSIDQIVKTYGRPNASTLIAGTNSKPIELLLYFDKGVNTNRDVTSPSKSATILPTTIEQAKSISQCADNEIVMNIVAHQDDDLLFMNPDLQHQIDMKHCIRTVYVTSGDAGQSSQYWLGRERASEAAYAYMLGINQQPVIWTQRTVTIGPHEFVTVVNPKGNRQVSLIFMRLPDGNLTGHGFGSSGFESLAQLLSGRVPELQAVDGQSFYTTDDLTKALTDLMNLYTPTIINTQAATNLGKQFSDHSDHISVGQFANKAYDGYANKSNITLNHYVGYPIRGYAENVFGDDLSRKTNAFLAYATFDGGVCQSLTLCEETPTYNAYLHRQYAQ